VGWRTPARAWRQPTEKENLAVGRLEGRVVSLCRTAPGLCVFRWRGAAGRWSGWRLEAGWLLPTRLAVYELRQAFSGCTKDFNVLCLKNFSGPVPLSSVFGVESLWRFLRQRHGHQEAPLPPGSDGTDRATVTRGGVGSDRDQASWCRAGRARRVRERPRAKRPRFRCRTTANRPRCTCPPRGIPVSLRRPLR